MRTAVNIPAGRVWDCLGVRILPANGTLTIRCTGEPVVPPGTPRWAAGGMVVNRYTAEPVPGATVTFANGATTVPVTTDANGIFSYVSGPVGDYSV
ncbi:MAG: carboxypeptidase-like regulatory domain-containing protein, partial [Thermoanaerobaculia bacterium]|nr:carboxypeptidase-like regulatory domain-containing protein [Thermoanaerobaculia bacterium]